MTRAAWRPRLSWGVREAKIGLLGERWDSVRAARVIAGVPLRPLLFASRSDARAWCREKQAEYRDRGDSCKDWRFRPVRVREIWEVIT